MLFVDIEAFNATSILIADIPPGPLDNDFNYTF
jgi:hypothetical protein